jgi:hypothetical protein
VNNYGMPPSDDRLLWQIWLSAQWFPSLMVCDEIGIFESLASRPATAAELSERLTLNPRLTSALLGMLTGLEILARQNERYCLTNSTRHYLLPHSPYYWGGLFVVYRRNNPAYATLRGALTNRGADSVAREQIIPNRAMEAWKSRTLSVEKAREVARLMQAHSIVPAMSLAEKVSYESVKRLLDVGGGSGCFSIALAQRNPNLRCTILDLPAMCEVAMEYAVEGGVLDRVDTYPADMFYDSWPRGYDVVFFSNIFHDWNAEACAELSSRAYELLPFGGSIDIHEILINNSDTHAVIPAAFSVLMATYTEGKQFTFGEIEGMLSASGFVDVTHTLSSAFFSLVSARK